MRILRSKKFSPFGKYRVLHFFKRIEFQHRGSPHAYILLWLDNAPNEVLGKDKQKAIAIVEYLVSVSEKDSSGWIRVQIHKHTFTCYKNLGPNDKQICRFEAPFWPIKNTIIIEPMSKQEPGYTELRKQYK